MLFLLFWKGDKSWLQSPLCLCQIYRIIGQLIGAKRPSCKKCWQIWDWCLHAELLANMSKFKMTLRCPSILQLARQKARRREENCHIHYHAAFLCRKFLAKPIQLLFFYCFYVNLDDIHIRVSSIKLVENKQFIISDYQLRSGIEGIIF